MDADDAPENDAREIAAERILSRSDLIALGYGPKLITKEVRSGALIRLRRDNYVIAGEDDAAAKAVRVGGRLTCVSALAIAAPEVFVLGTDHVHVHVERDKSRLRLPDDRKKRWSKKDAPAVRVRWGRLTEIPLNRHTVALIDAVRALIRCLPEREVVATIDSLLLLGLLSMMQVREVFASLPARYAPILAQLDPRAESGPESLMRHILQQLGVDFEVQVNIVGVGRVDLVVDGFLIIECDSKAFHEGWAKQREDRQRDLAAAAQGFFTLRVLAEDLLYHPERVEAALRGLLAARSVWNRG